MTTLTLAKLDEIEAAAAKATPVAWQLITHKGLAETWMRMKPPIDDVEEYRPLYADCDPATVTALCQIVKAAAAYVDEQDDDLNQYMTLKQLLRDAGLIDT